MNAFRCLRAVAQPAANASAPSSTLLRSSITRISPSTSHFQARTISLSTIRRPTLPQQATASLLPSASSVSAAPARGFSSTAGLLGPRDTYNPSHFVRKRRHGFLSRLRTKNGRKLLKRRLLKKRSTLSH